MSSVLLNSWVSRLARSLKLDPTYAEVVPDNPNEALKKRLAHRGRGRQFVNSEIRWNGPLGQLEAEVFGAQGSSLYLSKT